jgi:hypothetical protein
MSDLATSVTSIPDWGLSLFAAAIGFSFSGIVAAAWQIFSGGDAIGLRRENSPWPFPVMLLAVLFVCAFGGPYLVAMRLARSWRDGVLSVVGLGTVVVACALWSFCSGVMVMQALWAANLLAA